MFRSITVAAILMTFFTSLGRADDGDLASKSCCTSDVTTLRLVFPPELMDSGRESGQFQPAFAKLYVDDHYIGDAIVNLHGHLPTIQLPKSIIRFRVEMSENRTFETKLALLGHGSKQLLYVDIRQPAAKKPSRAR
ncbi:MAG: hypothetical protein HKN47_24910 [Pirellulaceae bacterium]|nr:hypothetical protein [Pirellulaceae bacterium]